MIYSFPCAVLFNPFMSNGLFYLSCLDTSFSNRNGCLIGFTEIPVFNANGVDPDQTPRSSTSDLGLHCLPPSLLWDARPKRVELFLQQLDIPY